jgi:glutamate synthase (ferredoxin)
VNQGAKVSVKLVAQAGIGTVASGVAKANADIIQISGHDGGTGASPISSIKHCGGPVEMGLAEVRGRETNSAGLPTHSSAPWQCTSCCSGRSIEHSGSGAHHSPSPSPGPLLALQAHQTLTTNGLRERVVLRCDGGMRTGRDVLVTAALGADEYGFGTVAMIATGCIMARVCHTNNCPVGVASQREELRARFPGEPARRRPAQAVALHAHALLRCTPERLALPACDLVAPAPVLDHMHSHPVTLNECPALSLLPALLSPARRPRGPGQLLPLCG